MKQPLIVKFLSGRQEEVNLLSPFRPQDDRIHVELNRNQEGISIPLDELCYVMVLDKKNWRLPNQQDELAEQIETTTGETFDIRVPDNQQYTNGFYAFPVDPKASYRSIFFTLNGIRQRLEKRPLTDILEENGWLESSRVEEVLNEQDQLRSKKVGEIIAENSALNQGEIEQLAKMSSATAQEQKIRIGDLLVQAKLVTNEQVQKALEDQKSDRKKRVGELLLEKGLVTEEQLLKALSTKFRIPVTDLNNVDPDLESLAVVTRNLAVQFKIMPLKLKHGRLTIATSDPTDPTIGDNLRFFTNKAIDFVAAPASQIRAAIDKYYGSNEEHIAEIIGDLSEELVGIVEETDEFVDSAASETDSQIISLVNRILLDAFSKGASDIHFEPGPANHPLQIRYRIDGACNIAHQVSATYKKAMISRIKIMAKLDIAERRKPQSGKIAMRSDRRKIEFRVETTPTAGGQEDAVLRILSSSEPLKITELGFTDKNREMFIEMLSKPYGIILCVGPTGSGKTTTLHSALGHINTPDRKIWTAEDPIEITQPGLRQVQIHPKIGFTFEQALRSFLRSDPDVIMVGEMRDTETAKTAIDASLTGHLVLSTLHTNSAVETAVRLIEMGMDPFNFANALIGILAQRLARSLCHNCREAYQPSPEEFEQLKHTYGETLYQQHKMPNRREKITMYRKIGCDLCGQAGYRGRVPIHELLPATEIVRHTIKAGKNMEDLQKIAVENGMRTLMMDGVSKILSGHTDLQQILRVCM
ncbi:GspE/PulE family protein [Geopsychrobacter electrodiphilus]|uniref:GspE/PulE family protein n=1 Tax=Geopsychrobacter electrodiphilus TaxID=225196 RepID=UPI00037041D0|nr:ATPase, T2SS/T4P/T4SS family [Geopsychrobacter electrodiphilus]